MKEITKIMKKAFLNYDNSIVKNEFLLSKTTVALNLMNYKFFNLKLITKDEYIMINRLFADLYNRRLRNLQNKPILE